jgi:hypothetical protein
MHVSHRTNNVKQLAQFLDIELHYISGGATDKLQPLDRTIFGALKSRARRLFRCRIETDRGVLHAAPKAAEEVRQELKERTEDIVREGWDFDEESEVQ